MLLARVVVAATRLDLFEALRAEPLTAAEVAARCGSEPAPTEKLLDALATSGYLRRRGPSYRLTSMCRRWLLKGSSTSVRDAVLYEHVEAGWLARLEEFVRSGRPLDFHGSMTGEEWALYQRGMRAIAGVAADELARRLPVPAHARAMLDVGGSHGYYAVALCRRHRGLHATVLDLPEAVEHARPILASERMGDRVVHQTQDVRVGDLGTAAYDVVLIAQLVHHFDQVSNRALMERLSRALRPGGILAIVDAVGGGNTRAQTARLLDLYFAFTSRAGTWSLGELAGWQRDAGLVPQAPFRLRTLPDFAVQVAAKPDW
jgi:2-polyprenyl-3-methyl-5-hydroxy-6-metoxy-1,4-benzoquinol methylase